jgi:hypothetical protein
MGKYGQFDGYQLSVNVYLQSQSSLDSFSDIRLKRLNW